MQKLRDRHEGSAAETSGTSKARPVVLATMSAGVDPGAERMAIESALEAGVPLILVNLIPVRFYRAAVVMDGSEAIPPPHEEPVDAVRGTAARAARLGIRTEFLRVRTRHAIRALMGVVSERDAGLLVFGPDMKRTGRLRFRLAARRVRRDAPCLVWIAPDG
jgi:Universal stress protein family